MNRSSKIYVAGHRGLVGSALVRQLRAAGYSNLLVRSHGELDLTERQAVREFFVQERPQCVFLAAAKVGGILANSTYPADFIGENLLIQTNVIHEAYRAGVERLLFLGSSCIYPRNAPQPIKEESLLTGPLEPTVKAEPSPPSAATLSTSPMGPLGATESSEATAAYLDEMSAAPGIKSLLVGVI